MKDTEKKLSYREKELMEIINTSPMPITTREIYQRADMAKATALKYLAVLVARGFAEHEYVGPTKLWWIVEHCPICDGIMKHKYVSTCTTCTRKKRNGKIKERW